MELQDASGNALARGFSGNASGDAWISNFVAPVSDAYFVHVTGQLCRGYSLIVTRNADFDTEQNDYVRSS